MKKHLLNNRLMFMLLLVGISACSSETSTSNDTNRINDNEFEVTVDGEVFSPPIITAIVEPTLKIIVISAGNGLGNECQLMIPESIDEGNYPFAIAQNGINAQYSLTEDDFGLAKEGSFQITKHDKTSKKMAGTFNFDAVSITGDRKFTLTNGEFDVSY